MNTDELIENIKKMNDGKLTTEKVGQIIQERNEKNKKIEEQLYNAKNTVDAGGIVTITMSDSIQLEIEKFGGKYKISYWEGTDELELIKTFKVEEFPVREWFEDKLKMMHFSRFSGMFGL